MKNEKDASDQDKVDAEILNKQSNKKSFWAILFAIWIVFIILSQVPFLAETLVDYSAMDETVESHLRFPQDGKQGHYYVERYDTDKPGLIDLIYTCSSRFHFSL